MKCALFYRSRAAYLSSLPGKLAYGMLLISRRVFEKRRDSA
jgi:hypothetical protein